VRGFPNKQWCFQPCLVCGDAFQLPEHIKNIVALLELKLSQLWTLLSSGTGKQSENQYSSRSFHYSGVVEDFLVPAFFQNQCSESMEIFLATTFS